jgi:hypothetical protein
MTTQAEVNGIFLSQTLNYVFLGVSSTLYASWAEYYAMQNSITFAAATTQVNTVLYSTLGVLAPFIFFLWYVPSAMAGVGVFQWWSNFILFLLVNIYPTAGFDESDSSNQILFYYTPMVLAAVGEIFDFLAIGYGLNYLIQGGFLSNVLNLILLPFGILEGLSLNGMFNGAPLMLAHKAYFPSFAI